MRKCHRVGDLNQEFIFSQLWRLEVQDEDTGGFSFFWGLSSSLQRRLSVCLTPFTALLRPSSLVSRAVGKVKRSVNIYQASTEPRMGAG